MCVGSVWVVAAVLSVTMSEAPTDTTVTHPAVTHGVSTAKCVCVAGTESSDLSVCNCWVETLQTLHIVEFMCFLKMKVNFRFFWSPLMDSSLQLHKILLWWLKLQQLWHFILISASYTWQENLNLILHFNMSLFLIQFPAASHEKFMNIQTNRMCGM